MPSLGEKIKALREERKWSQRHLGEAVGVSNSAVSQWESDKVVPGYETLNALSSVFATSLLAHTSDIEPSRTTIGRVPVLNAADLISGLPQVYAGKTTIEPSTIPASQAFAFAMPDRGMSPNLQKGNLVIAESGLAAGPGDYVVARIIGEPTAVVRRFRTRDAPEGKIVELVPNNSDFPTRRFAANDGDFAILGVVVEIRWLRDVS